MVGGFFTLMKKWLIVRIGAALAAIMIIAAALLLRGVIVIVLCVIICAGWGLLLGRFLSIKYHIDGENIRISSGVFIRSELNVKRSEILSQSCLYLGKDLICTIVRTAGKMAVLFCEIPGKSI